MPQTSGADPLRAASPGGTASGQFEAVVGSDVWRLNRPADLETLWQGMAEGDLGEDERLPYWVELWPAAVLLARFVAANPERVRGRSCLDAGCGLGLSALVAARAGGRVLAFDYEPEALVFARQGIELNRGLLGQAEPLFAVMDWRSPAVASGSVEVLLGADILYERRFFEPVEALLRHALAPDGVAFIADPERSVSAPAWERLAALGWRIETPFSGRVAQGGQNMNVHIRQISRC
ncbi:MAG: methyltransferase [Humidesulfovibrio sp.]|uniref:class I SAM-dependent methyltransferase n=1 Tax=Humidesulfovibrio sp. TaxID=2910988 RepID=UPI0027FE2F08|nr:methyltransferase domain-containing protein [Humidesulfovibrio sp.]MDQ7835137.1 methyltransferase [Humidesulfovibrio sp.]